MARKKLGEILIERNLITPAQLQEGLAYQRHWGHRLGAALVAKGFVSEGVLVGAIGEALKIPVVDLAAIDPDWSAIQLLETQFCDSHQLFPVRLDTSRARKVLTVSMADPLNIAAVDEIEFTTGCSVHPAISPLSQINAAISRYYRKARADIKKLSEITAAINTESEMVLVKRGGGERVVDTGTYSVKDVEAETARRARSGEGEGEKDPSGPGRVPAARDGDVALPRELTDRTALSEIIREHELRQRLKSKRTEGTSDDLDYLLGEVGTQDDDRLEKIERRFWGLMRLLAKKGILTKEEFLQQFEPED